MEREDFYKLLDYINTRSADIEMGLMDKPKLSSDEFAYLQGKSDEVRELYRFIDGLYKERAKKNDR